MVCHLTELKQCGRGNMLAAGRLFHVVAALLLQDQNEVTLFRHAFSKQLQETKTSWRHYLTTFYLAGLTDVNI